jgi:hypothetical protein
MSETPENLGRTEQQASRRIELIAVGVAAFAALASAFAAGVGTWQAWIASDTEQRQLRAYVSARIERHPDINSDDVDFTVVFKNNGQTPAFKIKAWVYLQRSRTASGDSHVAPDGRRACPEWGSTVRA